MFVSKYHQEVFVMQFYRLLLIFLLGLVTCAGCFGGPKKPAGLPELHPLALTLTQGGQPLADAIVSLKPLDNANIWAVGGVSDVQGAVKVMTAGDFQGAPAGKYKVTVIKTETEANGKIKTDYSVIDQKLTSPTTTTLEVDVAPGKNTKTLDVGEAVRIKVGETTDKSE